MSALMMLRGAMIVWMTGTLVAHKQSFVWMTILACRGRGLRKQKRERVLTILVIVCLVVLGRIRSSL